MTTIYGTDIGPACWRCQGTIWQYEITHHVVAACAGCHAVEGPINHSNGLWLPLPATAEEARRMHAAFIATPRASLPVAVAKKQLLYVRRNQRVTLYAWTMADGSVEFEGGRYGSQALHNSTAYRVALHWDGYCAASGLGLAQGRPVRVYTAGCWRDLHVLHQPKPGAQTVLLSGVRYKNGRVAKPRRWEISACIIP